ncbi:MAG: hypothetical protein ACYTG7_04180, partial [Planctomycetota bacterium]|jgi:hypothetical protein
VDLVAAIHLADPEFYDSLNLFFRAYDAVLYEMVRPDDAEEVTEISESEEESANLLSNFQKNLARALGLEFQLHGIDYSRPNFVHADLTLEQFVDRWQARGDSFLKMFLQAMAAQARAMGKGMEIEMTPEAVFEAIRSPDSARRIKFLVGREFENIEMILAGFEPGEEGDESLLVGERNKAALDVLKKQLRKGKRTLAIFYGAGHMPDMELRLKRDLGFKKTGQEWFIAWEIGAGGKK